MSRVIKSELLKYISGKMLYICSGILFFLPIFNYVLTKILIASNPETFSQIIDRFSNLSSQEYILNSLAELFSGGGLFIIVIILASSMITSDYSKGTMKYTLLATSREKLILGKIIASGIINFIYIAAASLSIGIIGIVSYNWGSNSHSIIYILATSLLCWITLMGITCLIMFAINRISSVGGAIGLGFGIYFVIGLLSGLLPESYKVPIISANIYKVLEVKWSSLVEILIVGLAYIIVFSGLSLLAFRKKEILS